MPEANEGGMLTLREYLDASDLTDGELAELVPCTRSYITNLANGKQTPSYRMAMRLEVVTHGMVSHKNWFPDREEIG